jgi:hypothetical protein
MDSFFVSWAGPTLINAALANIDRRSPLKYFLSSLPKIDAQRSRHLSGVLFVPKLLAASGTPVLHWPQ